MWEVGAGVGVGVVEGEGVGHRTEQALALVSRADG